jgi:hypothetical protein
MKPRPKLWEPGKLLNWNEAPRDPRVRDGRKWLPEHFRTGVLLHIKYRYHSKRKEILVSAGRKYFNVVAISIGNDKICWKELPVPVSGTEMG